MSSKINELTRLEVRDENNLKKIYTKLGYFAAKEHIHCIRPCI
jgi:hypothetical protein